MPFKIANNIAYSDNILYFLNLEDTNLVLYALLSNSGSILFKTNFEPNPFFSYPIISNNSLCFVSDSKIINLNKNTGQEIWSLNKQLDYKKYPVSNQNKVLASKNNALFCFNLNSGNSIWEKQFNSEMAFSPIINNGHCYTLSSSSFGNEDQNKIHKLNLSDGSEIWQATYNIDLIPIAQPCINSKGIYITFKNILDNAIVLCSYDIDSGKLNWEQPIPNIFNVSQLRPIASSEIIITNTKISSDFNNNIIGFDSLTGEQITLPPLEEIAEIPSGNYKLCALRAFKDKLISVLVSSSNTYIICQE